MPVVLERREEERKWPSAGTVAGGLGGNVRFTMVSRGIVPAGFPSFPEPVGVFMI